MMSPGAEFSTAMREPTGEEARVLCQTIGYDTSRYGI